MENVIFVINTQDGITYVCEDVPENIALAVEEVFKDSDADEARVEAIFAKHHLSKRETSLAVQLAARAADSIEKARKAREKIVK